jgi:ribosomal peptide maturation radical SAM protein 1
MPFASVHRPALGVSLLKAAAERIGISSKVHYFNLKFAEKIDLKFYDKISEGFLSHLSLIGELIFAGYTFGTDSCNRQTIEALSSRIFSLGYSRSMETEAILEIIKATEFVIDYLEQCASEILRDTPKLIGFSSTFYQNCASLSLSKVIKRQTDIPIIFGGANCEGEMGATLLKSVPWIDFVCSGEGDIAFIEFLQMFLNGGAKKKINGIITRDSNTFDAALTTPVTDLHSLPFPDFGDYFSAIRQNTIYNQLHPTLVLETSRGCWWGEKYQCTFCGLNGSTMKYRSKSIPRALEELESLIMAYGIKRFNVVDNIMDLKYIDNLFPEIYRRGIDVEFFYDTKSNLSKKQLSLMKQGGVNAIQPGIESLSDIILNIMKKGVTALQNIQLLKWCRSIGIIPYWNIIWGFPGEPEEEYDRMARIVPLLVHLNPPDVFIKVSLDRFSPYFLEPLQNGIMNVRPGMAYKYVYPFSEEDLHKIAYHFDFDYCDGRNPSSYVKNLREEINTWWKLWDGNSIPSLNMTQMSNMIMIADTRPCSVQRFHLLSNEEARIYEMCQDVHSLGVIFTKLQNEYPLLREDDIKNLLNVLVENKVMLCENAKYLSLAIPTKH